MSDECSRKRMYIPWFAAWQDYTPVIPKMYWDVESAEQRMHTVCAQLHKLVCYADYLGENVDINKSDIEELQKMFEQFMQSGFLKYYEMQIEAWINEHMEEIISKAIKMVFFGLTMDGYFTAYIPQSWYGIVFDTIANYQDDNYGCLTLAY